LVQSPPTIVVGDLVGKFVGSGVGKVGLLDGESVGEILGELVGNEVGEIVGLFVGCGVGGVGDLVGTFVVGDPVGANVSKQTYLNGLTSCCLHSYPEIHPGYSQQSCPGDASDPNGVHFLS
jgi:hypothetical protein